MKKRTAGIIKTVIIGVICVGIVVGFYYYLTNRSQIGRASCRERV